MHRSLYLADLGEDGVGISLFLMRRCEEEDLLLLQGDHGDRCHCSMRIDLAEEYFESSLSIHFC